MSYNVSSTMITLWFVTNKKNIIKLDKKRMIYLRMDTPYSTSRKIKDAFVPPKPNELDRE